MLQLEVCKPHHSTQINQPSLQDVGRKGKEDVVPAGADGFRPDQDDGVHGGFTRGSAERAATGSDGPDGRPPAEGGTGPLSRGGEGLIKRFKEARAKFVRPGGIFAEEMVGAV
jgi:hypothetical protein